MNKKKHDRVLFKADDDWQYNACVNWASWEVYAGGYKEAADRLVRSILQNRMSLDALIYPVVFLYRHWIELRLKEIISQGSILLRKPELAPMSHDLQKLWQPARIVMTELWPEADVTELALVDNSIEEFNKVDPTSTVFRYMRDKQQKISLPDDISHINVRNLAQRMDGLAVYLDGAVSGIDAMFSAMDDIDYYDG